MYRQKVSINTFYLYELKQKKMCITLADPDLEIRGRGVGVALKIFLTLSHFFLARSTLR